MSGHSRKKHYCTITVRQILKKPIFFFFYRTIDVILQLLPDKKMGERPIKGFSAVSKQCAQVGRHFHRGARNHVIVFSLSKCSCKTTNDMEFNSQQQRTKLHRYTLHPPKSWTYEQKKERLMLHFSSTVIQTCGSFSSGLHYYCSVH